VFAVFLLILVGGNALWMPVAMVFGFTKTVGLLLATQGTGRVGVLIATQAIGAIVSALNGVIVGVFYYRLRVAKEGVDINKIASVFD
jgi:hypothetical protein